MNIKSIQWLIYLINDIYIFATSFLALALEAAKALAFFVNWTGSGVPLEPLEALRLSHNAIGDISAVASLVWICLDELQEKFRRA